MIDNNDTIAAIATPPGRGGIGIVRISGPLALTIGTSIAGETPTPRQAMYCNFMDSAGSTLDKGIILYFSAPASYTGEDVIELQGHGGQAVLETILKQTLLLGARLAGPGEFTERAFLNNKLDLLQAEAVADLIDSSSEQAVRSAMRSLDGEFSSRIESLLTEIINIRVFVEGALDFPEEEIDKLSGSDIQETVKNCIQQVENILRQARNGRVLREGFSAAIVGAPNVGKSSLLNVLSQTNRAIVTPSPGTTRDVIDEQIILDGLTLNIMDTAGIRHTRDEAEEEGIRRAQQAAEQADLVLHVREAQADYELKECPTETNIPVGTKKIIIHNKIDILGIPALTRSQTGGDREVFLSAKTKEGLDLLIEQIKQVMDVTDTNEDVLCARTRHIDALSQTSSSLNFALEGLGNKKPAAELIAEELRQAQNRLESITGQSTPDDLLGEIFSSFCIGK
jgi:tRNA modification GTPase